MTGPTATVVSADLVARWWNELTLLIKVGQADRTDAAWVSAPVVHGTWETMAEADRDRLREIAHDLLVRLDEVGALDTRRVQKLSPVQRDHLGRRIGTPPRVAGAAPRCTCGNPTTLGTVHRVTAPCYLPE